MVNLIKMKRSTAWAAFGLLVALTLPVNAFGAFITAGELTVDLRGYTLSAGATTWSNQETSGDSLGDFSPNGGGSLNVSSIGGYQALYVGGDGNNALKSINVTPASMLGSSDGSVEAWVYIPGSFVADNSVVGWGSNDSSGAHYRGFRYAAAGSYNSGLFSAWYQDKSWDEEADLIADQWVHVAWVVSGNGTNLKGYVNGVLETEVALSPILDTATTSGISIGSRNWSDGSDAFRGYIADLRIHTGILSDADVLNNFSEGIFTSEAQSPSINGLNDQSASAGANVTLEPTVTGTEPIAYQWQENGWDLPGETNTTLTLSNVQINQDGYVYTLIASNAFGSDTNSMTLAIVDPSTTITQAVYRVNCGGDAAGDYEEDNYYSGGNAYTGGGTIDVSGVADSAPDAVYQTERWGESTYTFPTLISEHTYLVRMHFCENYHSSAGSRVFDVYANGVQVLNDYDIIVESGARYKAVVEELSVVANGSGEIVLSLGNEVDNGKFSGIEIIDPAAPGSPVISGLSDQTIVAGQNLTLEPSIIAADPISYQWSSNGIAIAGATNATLTLSTVQYAQNGTVYALQASNAYGADSAGMTLTVLVIPSITGLNNQAVAPGTVVTMAPSVFGVPAPTLQWYYNGGILSGSTTDSLSISNAQEADSGTYTLVASNNVGVVTNSVTLTVSSTPVAPYMSGPVDQTVVEGSEAVFCASVAGLPIPTLQWKLNGEDIPGETNEVITISNVHYSQNGDAYELVADNSAGAAAGSASLYVLVPPAISQQPTNIAVPVGSPATFSVTADGVPAVSYQWSRDGSPIVGATGSSYTVPSVTGADNGSVFSVTVSNSVDVMTSSRVILTALTTMSGSLLPTHGAAEIAPDQQLRIEFSGGTARLGAGMLYVYEASDDSLFATIDTSTFISFSNDSASSTNGALRTLQGRKCYFEPIAIEDNTAWITLPPTNRFEYGKNVLCLFRYGTVP